MDNCKVEQIKIFALNPGMELDNIDEYWLWPKRKCLYSKFYK